MAAPKPYNPVAPDDQPQKGNDNPVIIGIYGVPGCGKSTLLNELKQQLQTESFLFYDGSQIIAYLVSGGLDAFKKMDETEQYYWRQKAIETIGQECINQGKTGVVAGHYMFWDKDEDERRPIHTKKDLEWYTHILYLDVPAEVVAQRRHDDTERDRPPITTDHLRKWQQAEKDQLLDLCRKNSILFSRIAHDETMVSRVSTLLSDFQRQSEVHNLHVAETALDKILAAEQGKLKTLLVLHADRTLAASDTGKKFWKRLH
jgi:adenylate kinase